MKTNTTLPAGDFRADADLMMLQSSTLPTPPAAAPAEADELVRPDLVARRDGVRGDLQGALDRGEISEEQLQRFLERIEARLLAEQAG
ncbi:hypothetical protein NBM05_01490 [Rothia sp. AR01]|uniref:Uncharacterized protein n=1 Tax=Rothia santali TaxID=2949643 RepID=A0A9X2HAQ1_9MICC|nr:hypothetical protein [Rothia santali]MCP3424740.1 hypothetical protein [Rothia santali]